MPTGRITSTFAVGGVSMYSTVNRSEEGAISQEVTLPKAHEGDLTLRTDDDTGTITLDAGHDIVTGKVDVYWDGGVCYGMDATVTVNACAIDLGAGDNLPVQDTPVNVAQQVSINTDFDGDDMVMIGMLSNKRSHVDFQDSGNVSLEAIELLASEGWSWHSDSGATNPLAGNPVDSIEASNGDSSADATLKIGVLYSSV